MNEFSFLEDKIKETKEEIKSRKKWARALIDEYCKMRTQKSEITKKHVIRMHKIALTMVRYYENILKEQEQMLKELKSIK